MKRSNSILSISSCNIMDQTIIIGEMEEGTIFDDFNNNQPRQDQSEKQIKNKNEFKISIEELQQVVDKIKIKHRAEIDAIMIE